MTKYTFESSTAYDLHEGNHGGGKRRHHHPHRRGGEGNGSMGGESNDPTDGNGSLTYSAASSINSGTGESTDSSFADIMRVLDVQDSKELANYLKKEAKLSHQPSTKDEKSVANSLAYSTDAESYMHSLRSDNESALHGTELLGAIGGQPSGQDAQEGGSQQSDDGFREGEDDMDLLFAPAEHADSLKRRKEKKRRERKLAKLAGAEKAGTPRARNGTTSNAGNKSPVSVEKGPGIESRQGTPPPVARPPKSHHTIEMTEEEDVWYAKWWMFCFPDVKHMSPKR